MTFSMYNASVPICAQQLGALVGILDKAAAHCAAKNIDEAALLSDRLFPDMFTLARQIRQATDFGRNTPGRLAGIVPGDFAATDDASFAEAKSRAERSLAFVNTLTPAMIDGSEDKQIRWTAGTREMSFKGDAYLRWFGLPNFFFHCTTAYNILRHRGVELGKRDFLGAAP
jgi:uncharacterized protein